MKASSIAIKNEIVQKLYSETFVTLLQNFKLVSLPKIARTNYDNSLFETNFIHIRQKKNYQKTIRI